MVSFAGSARLRAGGRASPDGSSQAAAKLTRGLGYFSLALGTTQLAAPGLVNELIGVRDDPEARRWQRLVGVQELAAAAGILPQRRPVAWLWARTSSDVMHLAMLARAYRARRESGSRLAFAIASVVGCFAADAFASARMTSDPQLAQEGRNMEGRGAITVRAEREELAARWRSFEQDSGESRLGPIEIHGESPLSVEWHTREGAPVKAKGITRISEAPGGRGQEIHVKVEFDVPGGQLGQAVLKLLGDDPVQLVRDDLRRLKQLVETGQIARSEGAPGGSSARTQPKQRPAQHLEHANA